jgi:hypothetical protein
MTAPWLSGRRRNRKPTIIVRLLAWELCSLGGLDNIIFGLPSIIIYVLAVLLYVYVKIIVHERPSFPDIKVKQKRCC